ncbi:MAG: dienelactone hydrolase family protein [Chloroflexi bacterium]|nr:dienelactone hydrolase family protein [Chloroflexota bacterium]
MRPLEMFIPILLVIYLIWRHPRPFAIRLMPALALLATLLHLFIEGYRWQMIPLYILTLLIALSSLIKIIKQGDWKPIASTSTLLLIALAIALPTLLPLPRIPAPSGPFQVGTRSFEMVDESRKEIYSGKDEPRRYMIQVWYPADVKPADERAPWMENAEIFAPAIASFFNLPSFFFDHLTLTDIPAYINAEPATSTQQFPVILFSHGWNGFNAQNAGQALELASRGYVVVGIQHTYGAMTTVFPDGSIAPNNPKALPEDGKDPNYEAVAQVLVKQWAEDMSFTLSQLTAWNEARENPFFGKLDLSRVGVYGHSTGGGAAIQFCGTDSRCDAVLGMDPFMRPVSAEVLTNGVSQPSFFMFSQSWADDIDSPSSKLFRQFIPNATDNFGVIKIEGTKHYDFSDLQLFSPIAPQLGLKGPLNGKEVTRIVNSYLIDFFELTLKDNPTELFSAPSPFAEVKSLK